MFRLTFENTVSAICYSLCQKWNEGREERLGLPYNDVARFVLVQYSQMTDYLRIPMMIATLLFNLTGFVWGKSMFYRMANSNRTVMIASWKRSPIGFCRDFIRFFESLSVLPFYSRLANSNLNKEGYG
jgi:hypothetical protein